ncbi:MAG: transglutaminase domain-containing protein [Myxococcales bacterium]
MTRKKPIQPTKPEAAIAEAPWLVTTLRALVYALCGAAFAWPLAHVPTVFATAFGALAGALLSPRLARSRLRTTWLVLGGPLLAALGFGLVRLFARSGSIAQALGDEQFLAVVDALSFALVALALSVALSALSLRYRFVAFVEVALGGMIASQLVAEHRHGAINRPFDIADPILSSGGDPVVVFYALGGLAVIGLAMILIFERSLWRLSAHVALLLLLLGAAGLAAESGFVPHPEPKDALGLTGKPDEQDKDNKNGKNGRGRPDNDTLEFRDQERNRDQQTPVAVVLLHDDYSPPTGVYYFRQGAFSQFNGRRLVATTRDALDRDIVPNFPVDKLKVPEAPDAGLDRATLESTVALLADHTRPFGLEAPVEFVAQENPSPERFRRVYKVVSSALTADFMTLTGHRAANPKWSAEDKQQYLALPADPRYAELAHKIVSSLPPEVQEDPMIEAWAVREWLSKEGTYSLASKHATAEDPTGHFLFGDKTGYCVHFAHAAAFLLRSLGVPARVATGYAVEESARQGGSALLIASGAAHAWPEIYLDGVGWVVVDVQPERTLDPAPEPPDADLQRLLGQLARGIRPLPPDGSPPPTPWEIWLKDLARWARDALGHGLVAALGLLYLAKLWRRFAPWFASSKSLPRVAYRAELDRLAELGLSRRRGESREAFALRVSAVAPGFRELTNLHVGARFGSRSALARAGELKPLTRVIQEQRRRAFSWWRRTLGVLTPWSWLKAR